MVKKISVSIVAEDWSVKLLLVAKDGKHNIVGRYQEALVSLEQFSPRIVQKMTHGASVERSHPVVNERFYISIAP